MWPFSTPREPVHLVIQTAPAERTVVDPAVIEELIAIDAVLTVQAIRPDQFRHWDVIDRMLERRLVLRRALTVPVIPGRTS